jgi:hypothetical protein
LPWCLFGLFGPDRMPKMGKEADVIYSDASCTPALGHWEVGESAINVYANDP